ncbi:DinB family protein [Marinigracilibium pacificum]|uniref:DinB family protein n=1 Tax=Marinigracilibium pacificum TaxID=2729599 RepID=A0A848J1T8_9BACT|nr:DinB family protein [Marinigracilibium pacificum]NMM48434.1 DinB family protein [Marinigracilibium pacificum]
MSTTAQLTKRWGELKKFHLSFLDTLENEPAEFLFFKLNEEKWNSAQIINHLMKVEKNTFDFISHFDFNRKKEKTGIRNLINSFMLNAFLKSTMKAKVPTKAIEPDENPDIETMIQFYREHTIKFEKFIDQFPQDKLDFFIFKHPLAGKLNILQTIEFLTNHSLHHSIQITKLKRIYN